MSPTKAAAEPTTAELEAKASKAAAEAAAARQIIEERQAAAWRRRDAAIEAWDRQQLAEWDDQALAAEEAQALRDFDAAVAADPAWAAWVNYRRLRAERIHLLGEMQSVVTRYGINRRMPPGVGPGDEDFTNAVKAEVERQVAAAAGDAQDERAAARQAAGAEAAASG